MKKYIFAFLVFFLSFSAFSQNSGINYQAVILDPKPIELPGQNLIGQPLSRGMVCVKFSFLKSTSIIEYEEVQKTTTDEFGLINLTIGSGAGLASNIGTVKLFNQIFWDSSPKTLNVSISFDQCSTFQPVSSQVLNATPVAFYAESVDYKNVRSSPTKLSQFANDAGFIIPKDLDPLKLTIEANTKQIGDNNEKSEGKFLVLNQSVGLLEKNAVESNTKIQNLDQKIDLQGNRLTEQSNRINTNQAIVSGQIGNLTVQTTQTQTSVNNLGGIYENLSNKSNATDLGNSNPSNTNYPTQFAVKSYVDTNLSQIVTSGTPDATTLAAGKIQLAGDLGGTAANPTVPALANKENTANKSISVQTDGTSNTMYPSVKSVKDYVDQATMGTALQATVDAKADKNSPIFTGAPVLPTGAIAITQATNNNSTSIATTAFVQSLITSATIVDADVNTKGKIQLTGDLGGTAANPTVPGLSNKENSANKSTSTLLGTSDVFFPTQNAVKTYVDNQISSGTIADATTLSFGKIKLAGDLSGTAALPTIAAGAVTSTKILDGTIDTDDLKDASVSNAKIFQVDGSKVIGNIAGNALNISANSNTSLTSLANLATIGTITSGVWNGSTISVANGGTGAVNSTNALVNLGAAPISSPNFSGTPTAPTAVSSTNTTQLATTAFVQSVITSATIVDADANTKGKIQLTGDLGGTAASPTVPGLALKESLSNKSDNTSLGNSTTAYPTQNAVKTYVDGRVSSSTPDAGATTLGKIQLAGDLSGTATSPTIATGAVTSDKILDGTIVDADINALAAIVDTKLATIATAGKVSNSATTATDANTASAIVARDGSGNFTAGTITLSTLTASKGLFTNASKNLTSTGTLGTEQGGTGLTTYSSGGALYTTSTTAITSGTLPVTAGGTGVTALTGIAKGNGTSAFEAAVSGTDYSLVREISDEFTVATNGDTVFTLSHTISSNSKLKMYVNGIHISKNAFSLTGTSLTYDNTNNGNYILKSGDRIQFEYYY